MSPVWRHRLDVSDVFHASLPLTDLRDVIVGRIRSSRWFDADDFYLPEIVDDLATVEDVRSFDEVWASFYDWCDDHRVWVVTRRSASSVEGIDAGGDGVRQAPSGALEPLARGSRPENAKGATT